MDRLYDTLEGQDQTWISQASWNLVQTWTTFGEQASGSPPPPQLPFLFGSITHCSDFLCMCVDGAARRDMHIYEHSSKLQSHIPEVVGVSIISEESALS
jgi:hypothetical protein